jgi:hypothetical protein
MDLGVIVSSEESREKLALVRDKIRKLLLDELP